MAISEEVDSMITRPLTPCTAARKTPLAWREKKATGSRRSRDVTEMLKEEKSNSILMRERSDPNWLTV